MKQSLLGISINPDRVGGVYRNQHFGQKNAGILVVFRGFLPENIGCEGRLTTGEVFRGALMDGFQ